ncbi:hypothetical protein PFISCL1PPCAC_18140, partial [Pristionchus fissidentatus]
LLVLTLLSLVVGAFSHCGYLRNTTNRSRRMVIGGEKVKDRRHWPWQVSVQWYMTKGKTGETGWFYCPSGTVIAERWVLTAAHYIKY